MTRVLFRMLLGLAAGFVAWAIVEPSAPTNPFDPRWGVVEGTMLTAFGITTSLAICVYNAYVMGGRLRMLLAWIAGPILGIIGVMMGRGIGTAIETSIFHASPLELQMSNQMVQAYIARIIAITPMGLTLGAAIGAVSLDKRRILHGAIGGLIGAAVGAMLFDPIAIATQGITLSGRGAPPMQAEEVGGFSRALLFILTGGMVALFIGIVEAIAKQASLRLALGRNEGRDYPLFGPRTLIGRNELAQVPIFNDPAVAPMHAYVDRRGPVYWLLDGGSGAPTFLNGQPVSSAPLDHGAIIQVGNTVLQFLLKSLPRAMAPAGYAVSPMSAVPQGPTQTPMAQTAMQPTSYPNVPASQPTTVVQAQIATPTLVATDGPLAGQRYPLIGLLELGREAPGVTLRFDSSASRRHASIAPGPNGLILQDLGSTNGTFVNGQKVTSTTIKAGDLVKVGATTFRVE